MSTEAGAPKPLPLGPLDLLRPVGRGGMASVWEAVHRPTETSVAVKILHAFAAKSPHVRSAFRNEVRAVARMDHPSIVRIYDFGEVSAEDAHADGDLMSERCPYLVMSYMTGGTLEPVCGRLAWWEIRHVLLHLLDALAHAHARGLVHRDIKPQNVLLSGDRSRVRLSDFGIVHAMEGTVHGEREGYLVGTPSYMAPEQFRRAVRDYGPWTDFYALGCLAWTLIAGRPPFTGAQSKAEIAAMHRFEAPPPLEPRCVVPEEVGAWLATALAKDPAERFQRASEAARALQSMPERWSPRDDPDRWIGPEDEDDIPTDPSMSAPASLGFERSGLGLTTIGKEVEGLDASLSTSTLEHPSVGVGSDGPPLPRSWEHPGSDKPEVDPLLGTGLGLFWLRAFPVVGRQAERDRMWEVLRVVHNFGRAGVLVLRGTAGSGKSRLAQWFSERSHEVGGTLTLRAGHSAGGGASEGLGDMLGRLFRLRGLTRAQALIRLEKLLKRQGVDDPGEARALVDLIGVASTPGAGVGADGITRRVSGRERHRLVYRTLARLGRDRPLVLWLDDVHWSLETLEFVRHVLAVQDREPASIVLVLTVQEESLGARPAEARLLAEIAEQGDSHVIDVSPLHGEERRSMIRQLLPLESGLAAQVAQRTDGNPLFAVQLLGDWVDRELLEPGPRGFHLRDGATVQLPDSVHAVWATRVQQVLRGRPEGDAVALELAAALGQDIDHEEWLDACRAARLTPSEDLVDRLLDASLATCGADGPRDGWSLAHAMLRESLERRADDDGRAGDHQLLCARWLRGRSGPRMNERIASHLLKGGRPDEALTPLREAIAQRLEAGDLRQGESLLERYEGCLDQAEVGASDPRRGWGGLMHVRLAALLGDDPGFDRWAAQVRSAMPRRRHPDLEMTLLFEEAHRSARRGDLMAAVTELSAVREQAEEVHDVKLLAQCLAEDARLAESLGERRRAQETHRESLLLFEKLEDPVAAGRALTAMAGLSVRAGNLAGSAELLVMAGGYFDRVGERAGAPAIQVVQGLTARLQGDLPAAADIYREALERFEAVGSPQASEVRLALAQVLALLEGFEESESLLRECLGEFDGRGEAMQTGRVHISLLPSLAFRGDWARWDGHFQAGAEILEHTGLVDEELASCARFAGDLAAGRDEMERARAAWDLGRRQFELAGRTPDADGVKRSLRQVRAVKR